MYYMMKFSRANGRIKETLTSEFTPAMLKLNALRGFGKTLDCVMFDVDSGEIKFYAEGRGANAMPNICRDMEGKNIEQIAKGMLEAIKR